MRSWVAFLAMLAPAMAQTVDRTKPPVTPAIPGYKLPPVDRNKLPNGLEVILIDDARFPLVTARLNFAAGSKFDPPDVPGLAEAVATLLTEGTKTRNSRQFRRLSAKTYNSRRRFPRIPSKTRNSHRHLQTP